MAAKNPLDAKTRELKFQGIADDDTVQFVEHLDLGTEKEPRVTGTASWTTTKDAWVKAGAKTTAKVTVTFE